MPRSYDIAGYTYRADVYCPSCIARKLTGLKSQSDRRVESILDEIADHIGIDRHDERSFDSGDFPKVLFWDQAADSHEPCGSCGNSLT